MLLLSASSCPRRCPLRPRPIVASLCLAVSLGCGKGTDTSVSTVTTARPTSTVAAQSTQVQNYGDSITCGYYSQPADGTGNIYSNEGYAGLFDGYVGASAQNLCRGGDFAADMARLWVYPNAVPAAGAGQLYTVMIGTNDWSVCGPSAGCQANWALSLQASLAWLGLPAADKVLALNASFLGDWTPDLGFGMATSSPNATITFAVKQAVAGRRLYLAYRVFDAGLITPGQATLAIDGVTVDTLSTQVNSGQAIHTKNGTTDTIFLEAVPLGAAGTHLVTLTTSAAGGFFSVLWAGASTQNYASVPGSPRLMVAQILVSESATLDPTIVTYNTQLAAIESTFAAEGLYITPVLTYGTLNPATDMYDLVHPNAQGHAKVAAVFENAL